MTPAEIQLNCTQPGGGVIDLAGGGNGHEVSWVGVRPEKSPQAMASMLVSAMGGRFGF